MVYPVLVQLALGRSTDIREKGLEMIGSRWDRVQLYLGKSTVQKRSYDRLVFNASMNHLLRWTIWADDLHQMTRVAELYQPTCSRNDPVMFGRTLCQRDGTRRP